MKKFLTAAAAAAAIMTANAVSFAAANPFEDVPADHWAYDAVAQLAADGVIEGYGDGTYRGDRRLPATKWRRWWPEPWRVSGSGMGIAP